VQRLLHVLTWPMYNIQVIIPEYSVEGRRVDYALCDPASKPLVFIEVKQVGNIDGAERQLFEYAFHEGVPIALLTDGQKWRFFHPTGQGNYRERKVCELDLLEGDSEKSATHLNRYLNYEKIRTREAVRAIEEDYGKVSRQRQAAARLPEAWGKLVEEADEFLLHAVAEKTESLCGHRPTDEQVLDFLDRLKRIESRETDAPAPERKGDYYRDGSETWMARGKPRVASAAVVAEMRSSYKESIVIEGKGGIKYPMAVLVKHGIVQNTNRDKNANWSAVARIVGHS